MSERLADIDARIDAMRQLGAVVNAMRGIAAARAQQARSQLAAVDGYAAIIAAGIARMLAPLAPAWFEAREGTAGRALVVFCAEQGFAGAFSERVLDAVAGDLSGAALFLVGTRGRTIAAERGLRPDWAQPMPAHTPGIPRLADGLAQALYGGVGSGGFERVDVVYGAWQPGRGIEVERHRLLPPDPSAFATETAGDVPLSNLDGDRLLADLIAENLHARLCNAALHAFAAENEARMEAMASAHEQIGRRLADLDATRRQVRQEDITAEIVELAAGERANLEGD